MKHILSLFIFLATLMSCQKEEAIIQQHEVKFSLAIPAAANRGDRTTTAEVKNVVVTITDSDGNSISEREKIALYAFGDNYLSAPITLKTTGTSQYQLTEFMVTDANDQVLFATPMEGSNLAHLVADPLAIAFSVSKDQITTVTPEVLAVNTDTTPEEFGYGQFGFSIKETVSSVISAFAKGSDNFELTTAHLKVEGLKSEATDNTAPEWVYEADLEAKANKLRFRKAGKYALTINKEGYKTWTRNLTPEEISHLEVFLEKASDTNYDLYVMRSDFSYTKNNQLINQDIGSHYVKKATQMSVHNGDIYMAGYTKNNSLYPALYYDETFYVKNGQKVILDNNKGRTIKVLPKENNLHIISEAYKDQGDLRFSGMKAMYWKNGLGTELKASTENWSLNLNDMCVTESEDVFIIGTETILYTVNESGSIRNYYKSFPKIWRNGILIQIENPIQETEKIVYTKIVVDDGDYYVFGMIIGVRNPEATLGDQVGQVVIWKNGRVLSITEGSNSTFLIDAKVEQGKIHLLNARYYYDFSVKPRKFVQYFYSVDGEQKYSRPRTEITKGFYDVQRMKRIHVSGQDVFISLDLHNAPCGPHYEEVWYNGTGKRTALPDTPCRIEISDVIAIKK